MRVKPSPTGIDCLPCDITIKQFHYSRAFGTLSAPGAIPTFESSSHLPPTIPRRAAARRKPWTGARFACKRELSGYVNSSNSGRKYDDLRARAPRFRKSKMEPRQPPFFPPTKKGFSFLRERHKLFKSSGRRKGSQ